MYNCFIYPEMGEILLENVFSFPIAAVRNYHKVSALKQLKYFVLQFWRSDVQNQSYQTKIRMLAGLFLLEAPRENPLPCLSQHPEVACIPQSSITLTSVSVVPSPSLIPSCLSLFLIRIL